MTDENTAKFASIERDVSRYYAGRLQEHGPTPRGVDWNSQESQEIRFKQLLQICQTNEFSLNEVGCGFGALAAFIKDRGFKCKYAGCDIAPEMIAAAKQLYGENDDRHFEVGAIPASIADYTVASGIFNVKLNYEANAWQRYVVATLDKMAHSCRKGFAFNVLTSYSDTDRQRSDLYYADPCWFFDHCKRNYSKNVALLHDYELYEFTMLIRK